MLKYNNDLYDLTDEKTATSAKEIVPIIMEYFSPKSVIDAGCGRGLWLKEFNNNGVMDVLGVDFSEDASVGCLEGDFKCADWSTPLEINRKFDVLLSLEVAEHIDIGGSNAFIDNLTELSDIIVFSAAIPGQGGPGHVNEQWPHYWESLFNERGFSGYDVLRHKIWEKENVHSWYKQNIVIFIRDGVEASRKFEEKDKHIQSLVHPELYISMRGNGELFYINPEYSFLEMIDGSYNVRMKKTGDIMNVNIPKSTDYLRQLISSGGASFIYDLSDLSALDYLRDNDLIKKVNSPHFKVQKNPEFISRLSVEGRIIFNYKTKDTYILDPIEDLVWNTIGTGKNMMYILGETVLESIVITIPDLVDTMEKMIGKGILYSFDRRTHIEFDESDVRYDGRIIFHKEKTAFKREFSDSMMVMSITDGCSILIDNFYASIWESFTEDLTVSEIIQKASNQFGDYIHSSDEILSFIYGMHDKGYISVTNRIKNDIEYDAGSGAGLLVNWHNTVNDQKEVENFLSYSLSPWFAVCEVNYECNYRCITCYASDYSEVEEKTGTGYLSTEEVKTLVIDQLYDEKTFHITFMGGEPFIRTDFPEIYRYAVKKGMFVKIQSNGSLIDSDVAKDLKDAGVQQVEISIDGINPETNDYIRGKGTFHTAIAALKVLKDAQIPRVGICFTVTRHSVNQIEGAVEFARNLGIDEIFFSLYAPMSLKEELNKELQLTYEENGQAVATIRHLQTVYSDMILFAITDCEASKRVCAIGPSGDVRPCTLHSAVAGNLKSSSFRHIWYTAPIFREMRWPYLTKKMCNECGGKHFCSQTYCSAREYMKTGATISNECIRLNA